jgi:hypothetical protein
MAAPHQDVRVEAAIRGAIGIGVSRARELARGLLPVGPELEVVVTGALERAVRHLLAALGMSPRVDVTGGPAAETTITIRSVGPHDDDKTI